MSNIFWNMVQIGSFATSMAIRLPNLRSNSSKMMKSVIIVRVERFRFTEKSPLLPTKLENLYLNG
jgi:hypothetical protein